MTRLNFFGLAVGVWGVLFAEGVHAQIAVEKMSDVGVSSSSPFFRNLKQNTAQELEFSAPNPQPILERPVVPPVGQESSSSPIVVTVKRIQITGSTVFTEEVLQSVVAPFVGQSLGFDELLEIRKAITDLYTNAGYLTSGAFLPPQTITSGLLKVQVIEGELEALEIKGLKRLRSGYVRNRLRVPTPLNINTIERQLQLLRNDPLLRSLQAELQTGSAPSKSRLLVELQEAFPLDLALSLDNYESPSVGEVGGDVAFAHNNLFGLGDRAHLSVGYALGNLTLDTGYQIPITAQDTTLRASYRRGTSRIVEAPFDDLDIRSRDQTFTFGLRHPLIRQPNRDLGLGLSFDLRESRSFLLDDIPFSFAAGADEGRSRVSVLRLSQDWTERSQTRVLSLRSQMSLGLDVFNPTLNTGAPDGRFISWLGQFQWVQDVGNDILCVGRLGAQLTPDALLALEQFSIGGIDTVRGYRQNQQIGDNGIAASFEVQLPVVRDSKTWGNIQLVPFIEGGHVWNNSGRPDPSPSILASVGLGLRWQWRRDWSLTLDWGLPLTSVQDGGSSLQDSGLFFSLNYQPF